MSDNRNTILTQEARENAINIAYRQQQMEQHWEMIGLLETEVKRLKTELASMTAQHDAWKTTAMALEQVPERLETVELAAGQAAVLTRLNKSTLGFVCVDEFGSRDRDILYVLEARCYASALIWQWKITDTGRAALAAYRASHESEA